jgi:uncharacterized damage-inducible protein DinB
MYIKAESPENFDERFFHSIHTGLIHRFKFVRVWLTLSEVAHSLYPAKRYTKKPRQTFVSSSLDPLSLSAAVTLVFVC